MTMPRPRGSDAKTPQSSLNPENLNEPDRVLDKGHGTEALGPSGSSDSGSDIQGGPGMSGQVGLGLETGTTSDPDDGTAGLTAGPDIGDANLDSDSDSTGSGETAAASRDATRADGNDIDVDHVEVIGEIDNEVSDRDKTPDLSRERHRR